MVTYQKTSRRGFLGSVAAMTPLLLATQQKKQRLPLPARISGHKPKNVIFILSDDHRYDAMGFMGKIPFLQTPNMDRMAGRSAYPQRLCFNSPLLSESSLYFYRAICPQPRCG